MRSDYKNLIVWQKGMDLVVRVYSLTNKFPKEELFALSSQIKRASVSIVSNIAEGSKRETLKDQKHFLTMAFGSASELETQIEISRKLSFISEKDAVEISLLITEILKMLHVMIKGHKNPK